MTKPIKSAPLLFGVPDKKSRFDLPLHTRLGTEFLVMLLALMTSLCLLTMMGSISLTKMTDGWQNNLKNSMTIEIPYSKNQNDMSQEVMDAIKDHPAIKSATIVDDQSMSDLLKPWLGSIENLSETLPMPKLITIELRDVSPEKIDDLKTTIAKISDKISTDAHEEWLTDLSKLSNGIQIIGILLMAFISIVTFFAVSGAVRSRMAIHQTELELLHIMGAHDKYIRAQFQKYILLLAGKGILIGTIATILFVFIIWAASSQFPSTIPHLTLYPTHAIAIPIVAIALILISIQAARRTVTHVLKEIP